VASFTSTKKFYEFLPAEFTIKLHNNGNVHVAPVGNIFIRKGNTQVDILKFNSENGNILPGTNRVFDVKWDKGFPYYKETPVNGKNNKFTRSLQWDFGKVQQLRFGHY